MQLYAIIYLGNKGTGRFLAFTTEGKFAEIVRILDSVLLKSHPPQIPSESWHTASPTMPDVPPVFHPEVLCRDSAHSLIFQVSAHKRQ